MAAARLAHDEVRSLLLCDRFGMHRTDKLGRPADGRPALTLGADGVGSGECFMAREGELDSPEWKPRMILISL